MIVKQHQFQLAQQMMKSCDPLQQTDSHSPESLRVQDGATNSRVSVGKLCVHGMKVHFDERHVKVYNKDNKLLLVGHRDPIRNLYMIPIKDNGASQTKGEYTGTKGGTKEGTKCEPKYETYSTRYHMLIISS